MCTMKNLKNQCFFVAPALESFLHLWLRRFIIDTLINNQYFYCQISIWNIFHIIKYRTFVFVIVVAWIIDRQSKNSSALSIYCITSESLINNHHLNPPTDNLIVIFIYCIASESSTDNHHLNSSTDNSIVIFIYCIASEFSINNHHLNASDDNSIINWISFCSHIIFSHNLLLYIYNMLWTCDLILIIFILSVHSFLFNFWIHSLRFFFSRNRQKSRNSKDNVSSIIKSLCCWFVINMLLIRRHYSTSIILIFY